jgi:hypothetical protein
MEMRQSIANTDGQILLANTYIYIIIGASLVNGCHGTAATNKRPGVGTTTLN